jgi:diaminopimelate decarboxylase
VTVSRLDPGLLPDSAELGPRGLTVGGCGLPALAEEFGTPLFVYDEGQLRARCREAVAGFPDGVAYAAKAFLCTAMARLAVEEGMHLDLATGGEVSVARAAGVGGEHMIIHGNNKSEDEIGLAFEIGAHRIVADSFDELDRLDRLAAVTGARPDVAVRVNPGIDAHTHEYLRTGAVDSKFGFGLASGDAAAAVDRVRSARHLRFAGLHAHIGSQVFETSFFERAVGALAPFVTASGAGEVSVGGGLGVAYVTGEEAPTISEWASTVVAACRSAGIDAKIVAEPGRAIVAAAAVTLYTVGTIKEIRGVRTYVSVDGGMSDNPRPVLYGSGYEAFLPARPFAQRPDRVRIVGKHCESGDVIVHDAAVPEGLRVGDVLCTPVTGAYGHSMGSNYNMVRRPPVVFARDGDARLVVRRESYDDLLTRDLGV